MPKNLPDITRRGFLAILAGAGALATGIVSGVVEEAVFVARQRIRIYTASWDSSVSEWKAGAEELEVSGVLDVNAQVYDVVEIHLRETTDDERP